MSGFRWSLLLFSFLLFGAPQIAHACPAGQYDVGRISRLAPGASVYADRGGVSQQLKQDSRICTGDHIKDPEVSFEIAIDDCPPLKPIEAHMSFIVPTVRDVRHCRLSVPGGARIQLYAGGHAGHLGGEVLGFALPDIARGTAILIENGGRLDIPVQGTESGATLMIYEPGAKTPTQTVRIAPAQEMVEVDHLKAKDGKWALILTSEDARVLGSFEMVSEFPDLPISEEGLSVAERALAKACYEPTQYSLEAFRELGSLPPDDAKRYRMLMLSWFLPSDSMTCGTGAFASQ